MRLPESREPLALIELLPEAILLVSREGIVLQANGAAARLLGVPAGDLPGMSLDDRIDGPPAPLARLLADGARSAALIPGRLRLRREGGPSVDCRVQVGALRPAVLLLRLMPHEAASGRFVELNTRLERLQHELRERARVQAELSEQKEWLQVVLYSIGDAVVATDTDLRIVLFNRAAEDVTGWKEHEARGRPIEDVVALYRTELQLPVRVPLAQALRERRTVTLEPHVMLRTRQGTSVPIDDAAAPIIDAQGQVKGGVLVFRGIAERVRAERERRELELQLRDAQKLQAIGTLAGGIAHDFNNVLGAILGHVGLVEDLLPAEHPGRPMLDQIGRSGRRARDLVRQILTFSRRQPRDLRRVPLHGLVDETMGLLRGTLPSVGRLEVDLGAAPLPILADPTQIEQVVMNLVTNAWQALNGRNGRIRVALSRVQSDTPPEGWIAAVGSWRPTAYACLTVADDGEGMAPHVRERIFDPFFTTKPRGQGTGLGLAVTQGIVAEHGGAMALRTAPGQGARFEVYFPLLPQDSEPPTAPDAPQAIPQVRGDGQRVMYVDDDDVMRSLVEALLQRAGFQVTVHASPADALEALADGPLPQVLVTDFNMPGMSGLDLAEAVQQRHPGLPMLLSSGFLSEALVQRAHTLGIRALLRKEETFERLAALIHGVLNPGDGDPPPP